jgi:hypothetical protein
MPTPQRNRRAGFPRFLPATLSIKPRSLKVPKDDITYNLTKADIIAIFQSWNDESVKTPAGEFADRSVPSAETQADTFISHLNNVFGQPA